MKLTVNLKELVILPAKWVYCGTAEELQSETHILGSHRPV